MGTSVLCQHLACGALNENHNTAIYSPGYGSQALVAQMDSIALPVSKYLQDDRLCTYPIQNPVSSDDSGPKLAALALDLQFLATKYELIGLDSHGHSFFH